MEQFLLRLQRRFPRLNAWLKKWRPVRLIVRFGRDLAMFVCVPNFREKLYRMLFRPETLHQTETYTEWDRYPGLFAKARRHVGDDRAARLLSYGCSTGEEAFSLRQYFPGATIVGTDINRASLARARCRNGDSRIVFVDVDHIDGQGPFDVIFCLAVLQKDRSREPGVTSIAGIYPFAKFEAKLRELDRWLKPGGLLVVDNSDYRVEDSDIFSRYDVSPLEAEGVLKTRPIFNRFSEREPEGGLTRRLFVKRS